MYEAIPDLSALRQGDILKGLYIPRISLSEISVLHKLDAKGQLVNEKKAIFSCEQRLAVVLSHCCEMNNPGKREAFSLGALLRASEWLGRRPGSWGFNLAELVPILRSSWREKIDEVRAANKVDRAGRENRSINTYLFDPDKDRHHLSEPHVVDFGRVISVRYSDLPKAIGAKILQLDEAHRREFKLKLGLFYSR